MSEKTCTACKVRITNMLGAVTFPCPKCKKVEIIRCPHCRKTGIKYTCPACGFIGPN